MDEIIEALLALPPLPLSEREIAWLGCLVGSLETTQKTAESFVKAMSKTIGQNGELFIHSDNIEVITLYLHALFSATSIIIKKNHQLAQAWSRLSGDEMMPNDALLPLLIELLPGDTVLLTRLEEKLNQAASIEKAGEINFYIFNLSMAIAAKKQTSMASNKDNEKYWPLIMMLAAETSIGKLETACSEYKQYLLDTFKEKLMLTNKPVYSQYYENDTALDEVKILRLIDAVKEDKLALNEELTHLLVHKYPMLLDMHHRLLTPAIDAYEKLIEFYKKFSLFENWLSKKEENWGYRSLSLWAPVPTPESKFADIASDFANRVREYEAYCEKKSSQFSQAI